MEKILVLEPLHSTAIAKVLLKSGEKLTIGRTDHSDYQVSFDSFMSSLHFELCNDDSRAWIQDKKSRNGTYLNDAKIDAAELNDGDRITAGMTVFCVHLVDESALTTSDNPGSNWTDILSALNPFRKSTTCFCRLPNSTLWVKGYPQAHAELKIASLALMSILRDLTVA